MRRRLAWLAVAPLALACAWPRLVLAQSMLGNAAGGQDNQDNAVVVPPAPPVVAAPPAAIAPQAVAPSQPPGLVETPLPPANSDNGASGGAPVDNGEPAATPPPADTAGNSAPPAQAGNSATPGQAPAAQAQAGQSQPAGPDTSSSMPPPADNNWVPEKTAEIGVLDKVDGGASTISVPVGGNATVGDLQINVLACVARPPADIPDDAIFLAIQPAPSQPGAAPLDPAVSDDGAPPLFRGWMIRSIPGATVVGDASETLRVVSCS